MNLYHLAQINVARGHAPLDDPRMTGFVAGLEPINSLADVSPGFVWRFQEAHDAASHVQLDEDPLVVVNLSVWEDFASLHRFVYHSEHHHFLKERRAWFERWVDNFWVALWWVPAKHRPTLAEAQERLAHLKTHGPSATAFNFRQPFPPPASREDQ